MNRFKVLACHNHYADPGGESLVFDNLVRGLRDQGHTVVTYLRHNATIDAMSSADKLRLVGSSLYSSQTAHDIERVVATERPQIAIVQNVLPLMTPAVYSALRNARVPVIQACYNYRFVCPAGELYSRGEICERCLGGNYAHCAIRRCYRNSRSQSAWYASIIGWHRFRGTFDKIDRFQVPDAFMAEKLASGGLPRDRMFVNVNPFFVEEFVPTAAHRGYIAFVGRLVRQKGVMTLLEALLVSADMRVVLVGKGDLEPELRDFARRHGIEDRVRFAGPLWGDDMKQVLADACAVAVPSEWYDNLPLVLCQANASGKPVIASRINGIPEYVAENVNGRLFEPGRASELAACADQLLGLDEATYAALSRRARAFAEERLDFSAHYRVLLGEIEKLASASAA